ncbi:related to SRC1 - involved in sister chromatid segregation [Melanopsichium pennsylvanicum]|uniref:Related to SRC1 - involved in sister chromatid segregation n=2 Tax=Melanopsichium pennsylvanicum TaxID=63383 RepID=A0AAJ4XFQ7_9BASI|nr:related to SRC1-involved in sister chromatid segregation [Melanopsichium pennsylvanicum 4]SNX81517.1 related to SRC1 - involved in sister chromatid segregation [Melanopsichium pennsylvanicum]
MVERDDYMREGFDPNSLTMPQLRSILVEHQVDFSSAARKADLVEHFNQSVLPKTASIRKKNSSIVASGSGIIDMRDEATPEQTPSKRRTGRPRKSEAPATPAKTARTPARPTKSSLANQLPTSAKPEAEHQAKQVKPDVEQAQVPVKRRLGRPRKSAPATAIAAPVGASEPGDDISPRRVSFDPETSPPVPSSRKAGRLSHGGGKSDDHGTFSDTNPFQSGSEASPADNAAARAATSAKKVRRKTAEVTDTLRKKTSKQTLADASPFKSAQQPSPNVARTFINYMDQAVAATTPPRIISRLTGTTSADSAADHAADDECKGASTDVDTDALDDDDDLDAFASPSALAKLRTARRKNDKQRLRGEPRPTKSLSEYLIHSLYTVGIIFILSFYIWYARETRALGFCDTNSDTNAIVEDRRLTFLATAAAHNETVEDLTLLPAHLQPACTPCPSHANCVHGKVLGCDSDDWVLQPSFASHLPLSNWLLPLSNTAPRCYPDTQKLVLASELALAISHMLAEFKGEIVCGTQKPHATVRALPQKLMVTDGNLTYAIAEGAVKRSMLATRDARLDQDYFEQIWYMALFELTDPRSNIVRIPVTNGTISEGEGTQYFLAARQPLLSLNCRSRLALKGWMLRARLYVFLLLSVICGFFHLRYRLASARAESRKVATLVQAALERLQEQEYLHGRDPVIHPDDFVPLSHLRDHILAGEHKAKTRNRLWKKVAKIVEENSNVRTRQAQRKGEWLRVWQWVGVESFKGYDVVGITPGGTPAVGRGGMVETVGESGLPVA